MYSALQCPAVQVRLRDDPSWKGAHRNKTDRNLKNDIWHDLKGGTS